MKKLMYIVFFLMMATNLLAQETYVVDSVCVGAERTYRRDGEKLYLYDWHIIDHQLVDTFAVPGVDFEEVAGNDTTWGNEITHLWDAEGDYDLLVYVTTEHGCDTVEQGKVRVFPLPEVRVSEDIVLCDLNDFVVQGDTAWNHSVLYWASTGDGTFSDEYNLHPTYSFGSNDSVVGEVTLFLTAEGLADNGTCIPAVDSVTYRFSKPEIEFDVEPLLCYNDQDAIIRVNMLGGAPPFDFAWTGPDGYTSADSDSITGLGAGWYYLTVTDANDCYDIDSVEIVNPPELVDTIENVIQVSCYGYSDGAIAASASGGTGILSFSWTSELGASYAGDSIYNLPADTYYLTVTDENGCTTFDTVVLPEPEILLVDITADDTILCEGDVVILHGNPVGGTGELTHEWTGNGSVFLSAVNDSVTTFAGAPAGRYVFTYTITDEALCKASDSIVVNVYPPTSSTNFMEVCFGEPAFTWNNLTITSDADRIYLDTLFGANQYGCDSLLTLEVDVLFPETYDTIIYVCENDAPYQPYGNITILPDRDSIYLDTVRYVDSGCDSLLVTINVFSQPVTDTLLYAELCSGADEFQWNNRWIQTDYSEVYLDTMVNSFGCDSLLTYNVTINPPDTTFVFDTLCQDTEPYAWNDTVIVQTAFDSTYEATLQNSLGCDSLVYLEVHILPKSETELDTMVCYADLWYPWSTDKEFYAGWDSTYTDTLINQWGCDSVLFLNVEVQYPDTVNIDTTICEGEPVFAWGVNPVHQVDSYTDSIYTDVLQNQFGCDSIVNLDVRILRPVVITDTIEICENEPAFVWHSLDILTYRDSIYTDTLYYEAGCDSLRLELTLISHPISDTIIDTILCEGSPEFAWNTHTVSTFMDSTYLDTLPNMYGCDSTITLNVEIVPAFKDTFPEAICYGEPIADWYGQVISSEKDSVYIHNVPGPAGCDTLLYYEVTILPVTYEDLDTTLCYGLPDFMWNNRLISGTASDFYLDTLVNSYGCDSLLTYTVTILPPDTTLVYDTMCVGDPGYDWNGWTVSTTEEDIYEATLQTAYGCDSVAILYTTLLEGGSTYDTIFACEEYYWEATDETYTTTGDAFHIVGSETACPDTSWLHMVISPPIVIDTLVQHVLCYGDSTGLIELTVSGGMNSYSYEWSNGETTQNISNLTAGIYTVTVTTPVTDTLDCYATMDIVITEPTPVTITEDQIVHVDVMGESTGSIEVTVAGGTPAYTYAWINEASDTVDISEDLFNQPAGDYTLTVTDDNGCIATFTATITEPVPLDKYMAPLTDEICYEELVNYSLPQNLSEYLALDTSAEAYSLDCDLDTSTFDAEIVSISNDVYCYEEVRRYSIVTICGDTLSATHRIIVDDREAPEIYCPPDFSVSNGIIPAAYDSTEFWDEGGSMYDNCGIVSFELIDEQTQDLSDHILVTRTYEVTDYCGNVNQCVHIIKVYSDVAIDLVCSNLPKVYYECSDFRPNYRDTSDFWAAGGRYYSSVPIDTFFYTDKVDGVYCPTINRTYTLRNVAGQTVTCTQTFEVLDDVAPTLILPDKHIYCNESWPLYSDYVDVLQFRNSHGNDAFDNCGNRSIRSVALFSVNVTGTCPTVQERVYRITDQCGNFSFETELVYINDTIPPDVTNFPYELTVSCDVPEPYTDASLYANDDCEDVEIIHEKDSLGGIDEPGVVYRFYTFSDGCNDVPVVQKITVVLDEVAEFDGLSPLCQFTPSPELPDTSKNGITGHWEIDSIPTGVVGTFTYIFYPDSGQCAGPADIVVEILPAIELTQTHLDQGYNPNPVGSIDLDIAGGSGSYTINWNFPNGYSANSEDITNLYAGDYWVEVSDEIGCYDSLSVTLLAYEPEFSCPPDTLIECPDITQYPGTNDINEFIAMGGYYDPISIFRNLDYFDVVDTTEYCLTIERTYVVEDIYGRRDSCTQTIDFYDLVPPVIVAPDGDTAECLSTIVPTIETFADFLAMTGTDAYDPNCTIDPSTFTVRDTAIVLQPGRSQVIYYFSIEDFCGNIGRDTTYYLITDDEAPEVWCADITVYLDENGQYHLTIQDSMTMVDSMYDNCTAPEDMRVEIEIDLITCEDVESGAQARITVYDEGGLSAECTANITVVDNLPPEAICQDITIYLDETGVAYITPPDIDNGSFDNCELDSIWISRDRFDCFDVGENEVELYAVDVYGLRDTCIGIVTVIDPVDPYIVCRPLQTIQLDEYGKFDLSWDFVTDSVSDECGIDTVLLDDYELDCDNIGFTIITVTAYDVNGNSSTCEAEFEVFGNIPPNVQNDTAVTAVNVAVEIPVTNNDYDLKTNINLESLGVLIGPSNGSVVVDNETGIVTYTPNLNYEGPDVFRYTICDDGIPCEPECGEAIVFITVRPVNEPPVAVDDYYEVPCGELFGDVTLNDSDPDGDQIFVNPIPVTPPDSGALTLFDNGNFEYIPFDGFFGTDSFQYVICDNGIPSLCDTAWVYITRVPDNDCDGVADAIDIDDDNDGIRDNIENGGFWPEDQMGLIDSDNDGIPDYMDIDSDNDGIPDNIEGQGENNYVPPSGIDANGDGWDDVYDVTIGGVITFDEQLTDTDGDSMPDYLDIDSDNDGVFDMIEGHDADHNGIADVIRWYSDEDQDGLDDAYDTYSGWADYGNELGSNAPLQDFDDDGTRDWRDTNDEDDEYQTVNEDLNGNGDYSDDDLDLDGYPEYLDTELNCELFIPEGFSPNDDGVHDFFQILCIQKYPNNKLMIFNRNGVKLWEKEHYGILDVWGTYHDAWWWGTSENVLTIGRSGGLPAGNYIYVLILNDGKGTVKNGTVMLAY
ncbi:Ig-like domain-containing protein [Draconibacterium halophilum]|uniref:HYR domain-containing protein n=1 Tax=Draconibacterium halophilum TaxID=2706887 RepID=A0A6C0R8A5_9BACT|nr:Ig-like domain-containing protein [Draconibacterium halophilum]QIA06257.1 hypothetical protein G0Q07_00245 [Draconibacterium halophilum]